MASLEQAQYQKVEWVQVEKQVMILKEEKREVQKHKEPEPALKFVKRQRKPKGPEDLCKFG
jgi:hypothetical protein